MDGSMGNTTNRRTGKGEGGAAGGAGGGTRNGSSAGEQRRTGARPQDTRALPYGAHGDLPDAAVPHSELASQVTIDNPDDAELVPEAESVAAIEDAPTQVVLDNPDDG